MSEASPPLSSTALPAKVTVAWGSTLLDVRHLAPGASWWVGDLRVEATTHGTRVVSGDAVVMAAGRGETVKRAVAGLSLTLEPPAACERARGAAREVDVRFVKVVSVAALAFVAVVALFELTPLEDPTGGDVFAGLPVRLFVAPPVEKAVVRRPIDFRRAPPSASTAAAPLLAPRDPAGRARTPAAARARVTELVASLFGGGLGQVLRPGPNDAIDAALSALGPGRVEGSAE
ncbi:MAG: hypothetical protein INH37_20355, partial [Myxococcaceae bacterium]|nr:hypothetical protein [Myxococcaceae bacterium]